MFSNQFVSASALLTALGQGEVTSVELLNYFLTNIEKHNGQLNAIVQMDIPAALAEAKLADEARAQGKDLGPLHGLPCTIKDSFNVKGLITCSGAPHLKNNMAEQDAPVVKRLRDAGAIILGKTNVPMFTADWQTYNEVYGVTNNPWDLQLTPGGSSGGAAAALAADLTPIEVGSDIGGCLRIPAHYCGVFGHRSSYGLMSVRGHVPGNPNDQQEPELASAGPMARTAEDLRLMMKVLYEPWVKPDYVPQFDDNQLVNKERIKVFAWMDSAGHPIDHQVMDLYQQLLAKLEKLPNVDIVRQTPQAWSHEEVLALCVNLSGRLFHTESSVQRLALKASSVVTSLLKPVLKLSDNIDAFYDGMTDREKAQIEVDNKVAKTKAKVTGFFQQYDVLLSPICPGLAHPHMHKPMVKRRLPINNTSVHYYEQVVWSALATLVGFPATVAPVGVTKSGLPCGIQVMSGYFRDDVTIDFAQMIEQVSGGFVAPPAYQKALNKELPIRDFS